MNKIFLETKISIEGSLNLKNFYFKGHKIPRTQIDRENPNHNNANSNISVYPRNFNDFYVKIF